MHDSDPADLDGDGEFDAIDIAILEEGEGKQPPESRNNGCGYFLTVTGLVVMTAVFGAGFYLI